MSADGRSYAWHVDLTAFLADDPPHTNGRSHRRRAFRTRTAARDYFAMLCVADELELRSALGYVSQTRAIDRFSISWGSVKEHGRLVRPVGADTWPAVSP